jgi:hypothetical protein
MPLFQELGKQIGNEYVCRQCDVCIQGTAFKRLPTRTEKAEAMVYNLAVALYCKVCGSADLPCTVNPKADRRSLPCWSSGDAGVECWKQQARKALK